MRRRGAPASLRGSKSLSRPFPRQLLPLGRRSQRPSLLGLLPRYIALCLPNLARCPASCVSRWSPANLRDSRSLRRPFQRPIWKMRLQSLLPPNLLGLLPRHDTSENLPQGAQRRAHHGRGLQVCRPQEASDSHCRCSAKRQACCANMMQCGGLTDLAAAQAAAWPPATVPFDVVAVAHSCTGVK